MISRAAVFPHDTWLTRLLPEVLAKYSPSSSPPSGDVPQCPRRLRTRNGTPPCSNNIGMRNLAKVNSSMSTARKDGSASTGSIQRHDASNERSTEESLPMRRRCGTGPRCFPGTANPTAALEALETEGVDFVGTVDHAAHAIGCWYGFGGLLVKASPERVVPRKSDVKAPLLFVDGNHGLCGCCGVSTSQIQSFHHLWVVEERPCGFLPPLNQRLCAL